jgi:large subunit ribosomal protein L20
MTRVRRGTKKRQYAKKIFKLAKGYSFDRRTKIRHAMPTVERALHYAYKSRRLLKRDMRSLWIVRINAAVRQFDLSYSQFISLMSKKEMQINRKMLADLAATDMNAFAALVNTVKA